MLAAENIDQTSMRLGQGFSNSPYMLLRTKEQAPSAKVLSLVGHCIPASKDRLRAAIFMKDW